MRFLEIGDEGTYRLTRHHLSGELPRYAILSHTWGAYDEEVLLQDLQARKRPDKKGFKKIQFCIQQAQRDGLRYAWIDSCCIDQSSTSDVSEALNSMFRYYSRAVVCYVYLADVSCSAPKDAPKYGSDWEFEFRRSRWFTRGWTLQELISPSSVEFFSTEGTKLGSKMSLKRQICETTLLPARAVEGDALATFTIEQRLAWQNGRETKREEDLAYSLLGICGVYLPIIYGEGKENAFRRLRAEIETRNRDETQGNFSLTFKLSYASNINNFVGRAKELYDIHQVLQSDRGRCVVVLRGIGGIGKTQLALAYAKRHRDTYSAVLWLDAKSKDTLKSSFAKVAKSILEEYPSASGFTTGVEGSFEKDVETVRRWLGQKRNTKWLLILDNRDTPKIPGINDPAAFGIRKYLPDSDQGAIIITTRSSYVDGGECIRVKKFEDVREGLELLSTSSGLRNVSSEPYAKELAYHLDGLPLAIVAAGLHLGRTGGGCKNYLENYNKSWTEVQRKTPYLTSYNNKSILDTWQASLDRIQLHNQKSAGMLYTWAYYDHRDVFHELHKHEIEDEVEFRDIMRVLCDYGIAEMDDRVPGNPHSGGYSIHSCIQSWVLGSLIQPTGQSYALTAVKCVSTSARAALASKEYRPLQRLAGHAQACLATIVGLTMRHSHLNPDLPSKLGNIAEDAEVLARLLYYSGKKAEAESMYKLALGLHSDRTDPEIPQTMTRLSTIMAELGHKSDALSMQGTAVLKLAEMYGRMDERTMRALLGLADMYMFCGVYDVARHKYDESRGCGIERADIIVYCENMGAIAELYGTMDELDVAVDRLERAYQASIELEGEKYLEALRQGKKLAVLYHSPYKREEAKVFADSIVERYKAQFGPDHPETLKCMTSLAQVYPEQEAETMLKQAQEGLDEIFGAESIEALTVSTMLGGLYQRQQDLSQAEEHLDRALRGLTKLHSENHPTCCSIMVNLGLVYRRAGRLGEAVKILEKSARLLIGSLGAEHRNTKYAASCWDNARQELHPEKAASIWSAVYKYTDAPLRALGFKANRDGRQPEWAAFMGY